MTSDLSLDLAPDLDPPLDPCVVARWALGLEGRDAGRCRALIEAHAETIRAAVEPALSDPPRGAGWLAGLEALAAQDTTHDRYFALVEQAAQRFAEHPTLAAWLLMRRGRLAFLKGFYRQAAEDAVRAERLVADAPALPSPDAGLDDWPPRAADVRGDARLVRGVVARNSGDPLTALALSRAVADAAEARGARPMALRARFQIACALQVAGRHAEAEDVYRALFGPMAALGAERQRALVLANLGLGARARGEDAVARAWLAEAAALLEGQGDRLMQAKVAALAADVGPPDRARIRAVGDEESRLLLELERAEVLAAGGALDRAAVVFDQVRWTAEALSLVCLAAAAAERRAALSARAPLRIDPDGFTAPDGRRVDLRRRSAPRLILRRLAHARSMHAGPVPAEDLIAAGWPGERMGSASGLARVYTAVRTLRRLGLDRWLHTDDGGYRLIGPVQWRPAAPDAEPPPD